MAKLIVHKTVTDFLHYNEQFLSDNYIALYSFIKLLQNRGDTGVKLNNGFNIIDNDGSFLIGVLSSSSDFHLYAMNWNEAMLLELNEFIHLNDAPKGLFLTGTKNLIKEIIKTNALSVEIFKDRSVYECNSINTVNPMSKGTFGFAEERDLDAIGKMSYSWHKEEYGKEAFRTPEFMRAMVEKGIAAQTFLKWSVDGEVASILQVMYSEDGYPIIGHFYTMENLRNRGYGTALIVSITNLLLEHGHEKCGLISDNANVSSNIVFNKAGYRIIHETLAVTTQ
jgi:predicted GNAT family acetyltransferase